MNKLCIIYNILNYLDNNECDYSNIINYYYYLFIKILLITILIFIIYHN